MKTSRAGQLALFFCPFLTYLLLNLRILGGNTPDACGQFGEEGTGHNAVKGFGTHLSIAKIQKFRLQPLEKADYSHLCFCPVG